jgi:primase-polymerase (primpol)-like protein
MMAPDPSGIPAVAQLAERGARFVLWKNVPNRDKPGKRKKLPLQVSGEAAASTNPATWSGLDEAVAAARRRRVDGIGFVFNGDGIGGVDLDGCRDPATEEISPGRARSSSTSRPTPRCRPAGPG